MSHSYQPRRASRSAWHEIRGVRYHVREWGDPSDPLLVFLHGWGDCSASFQFVVDELEREWFVAAPDWRGFGETASRASSYWFPDYLADLDALLSIYSPANPVHLLGHSMGGNAGGLYAGVCPERVAAFLNVEGFGLADSDPADAPGRYRQWLDRGRQNPGYRQFANFGDLAGIVRRRSPLLTADRALFVAQHWGAVDERGAVVLRADPAHKLPNPVLYRRAEAEACWSRIRCPVLLVCGAGSDYMEMLEKASPEWPEAFRGARLETVADAGHMVHLDTPAKLAAIVGSFFGG